MSDIVNKCEEAYNLIQRCHNNESALVEEKINVRRLVDDVSALLTKCELEPVETTLTKGIPRYKEAGCIPRRTYSDLCSMFL